MGRLLAVFLFVMIGVLPEAAAAGRAVSVPAGSGRSIPALVFDASRQPAPVVVLVPMLGRTRDDWQAVGQRLADAGITALAIELPDGPIPADARALTAWSGDVHAALTYAAALPGVRAGAIGLMGASLGANLAAVAAGSDPRVRALALLSPSLDYRGVRIEAPMQQYGARPALLVAARQDPYAARTSRQLADNPPGPREPYLVDAAAHGTAMFAADLDLERVVVEWFQRWLAVN